VSSVPRVDAMKPRTPGPTRTADPRPPDGFPTRGNYLPYLLFGTGGLFLMIEAVLVLEVVWALGSGESALDGLMEMFASPLAIVFHVVAFAWLSWFTLRFFSLFPKTQPFRVGPFKRPPDGLMVAGLSGLFVVATLAVIAILWGALG
jgi:fumarate reductase subunit C